MRKYFDKTTVMALAGFTAGYIVGRRYTISVKFDKVFYEEVKH